MSMWINSGNRSQRRLGSFAAENGWFLLTQKVAGGAIRRLRDMLLARQLNISGVRLGRTPRLLGLRHCRLGTNFSAGNDLWLEAVTSFAGQSLNPTLSIGADCSLSDHVHIGCANDVSIGDGFLCGSRVLITDHAHGIYNGGPATGTAEWIQSDPAVPPNRRPLSVHGKVWIGRNVWIGDGVAVLAGAHIGDGSIIGANSLVNSIVPPGTIAGGSPLKLLRRWDPESAAWVRT